MFIVFFFCCDIVSVESNVTINFLILGKRLPIVLHFASVDIVVLRFSNIEDLMKVYQNGQFVNRHRDSVRKSYKAKYDIVVLMSLEHVEPHFILPEWSNTLAVTKTQKKTI